MRLTDILTPARIKVPLTAGTKRGLIDELVDVLDANGDLADRDRVLQAVLAREENRTTGIGGGLAIPHGKCGEVKRLVVALGRCAQDVDFNSIDGKPVRLLILLVSPMDQTGPHIQALARISRLMGVKSLRNRLCAAASPEEMFQIIQKHELEEG